MSGIKTLWNTLQWTFLTMVFYVPCGLTINMTNAIYLIQVGHGWFVYLGALKENYFCKTASSNTPLEHKEKIKQMFGTFLDKTTNTHKH